MGQRDGDDVVTLRGVTKRFDELIAVDRLDLSIRNGEFLALLGPSGCGKTTTLRMIGGFEDPTEGEIAIDGTPVTGVPPHRRQVNTVFQQYALFPHMSVLDNVAYGLKQRGMAKKERHAKAKEALALVHLEGRESSRPNQLSGGQQQRVALARALVLEPKVLLLDEPLGALDQKLRKAMQIELKRLQGDVGITFVFVTHDQEEAMAMADRIAVMNDGRVEQLAIPGELYDEPATPFVADFIGDMSVLEGTLAGDEVRLEGGGRLPLGRRLADAANGAAVRVGVRPESAELRTGPAAAGADADATVITAMVLGDRLQVVARLGDGQELLLRQGRTPDDGEVAAVQPGDRVGIAFRPRAGLLIGEAAGDGGVEKTDHTLEGAVT
jgi:spermidine/putrescine ABC transporter ATP-binding subunit